MLLFLALFNAAGAVVNLATGNPWWAAIGLALAALCAWLHLNERKHR